MQVAERRRSWFYPFMGRTSSAQKPREREGAAEGAAEGATEDAGPSVAVDVAALHAQLQARPPFVCGEISA